MRQVLPQWREEHKPDAVIVNVENMAHGKGVTLSTMKEIEDLGIDVYTGGNHIFSKHDLAEGVFEKYPNLIRPANFVGQYPGHGYYRFSKAGQQYLVLNLNAQVFMETQFESQISNPFAMLDDLVREQSQKGDIIVVDFHSEASSEKIAFGWHADGKVTAVLGTHTHVPTADGRILPQGTAYISDVGMTGARDGIIGVVRDNAMKKFFDPSIKFKNEPEEEGVMQINGVILETDENGKAKSIKGLHGEIN